MDSLLIRRHCCEQHLVEELPQAAMDMDVFGVIVPSLRQPRSRSADQCLAKEDESPCGLDKGQTALRGIFSVGAADMTGFLQYALPTACAGSELNGKAEETPSACSPSGALGFVKSPSPAYLSGAPTFHFLARLTDQLIGQGVRGCRDGLLLSRTEEREQVLPEEPAVPTGGTDATQVAVVSPSTYCRWVDAQEISCFAQGQPTGLSEGKRDFPTRHSLRIAT